MREKWLSDQGKNAEAEQILPGVFATRQRVLGSAPTLNIANFNAKGLYYQWSQICAEPPIKTGDNAGAPAVHAFI